jgi:hypothetical protein
LLFDFCKIDSSIYCWILYFCKIDSSKIPANIEYYNRGKEATILPCRRTILLIFLSFQYEAVEVRICPELGRQKTANEKEDLRRREEGHLCPDRIALGGVVVGPSVSAFFRPAWLCSR